MGQLRHLNELILRLSQKRTAYVEMRDSMLASQPQTTAQKRMKQALQYENLIARITELDTIIEALIDTKNLEKIDLDQRRKERRKKDRRKLLEVTSCL